MGTRISRLTLALGLVCLGTSTLAWADAAPAAQAPATPVVVAQAPEPATEAAVKPELLKGVVENARGTVYLCDDRHWEVWSTVGSTAGLRPNAKVEFVRQGEVVATGTVKTVRDADCIITPDKGTPAGAVVKGDDMRIVQNGTRADLDRAMNREKRTQQLGTLFLTLLLTTTISMGH